MGKKVSIESIILDDSINKDTLLYRDILLWPIKMIEENTYVDGTQVEGWILRSSLFFAHHKEYFNKYKEYSNSNDLKIYRPFRFSDIGKWLIEHHRPFIEEYANSHIPKSYRMHTKRNYIQSKIDDLVQLRLIQEKGIVKSEKNNSDISLYAFTKEGIFFGWLIEAINAKEERQYSKAIKIVFDILILDLYWKKSSVAYFLYEFLCSVA